MAARIVTMTEMNMTLPIVLGTTKTMTLMLMTMLTRR